MDGRLLVPKRLKTRTPLIPTKTKSPASRRMNHAFIDRSPIARNLTIDRAELLVRESDFLSGVKDEVGID